jgi:hypothetical protein
MNILVYLRHHPDGAVLPKGRWACLEINGKEAGLYEFLEIDDVRNGDLIIETDSDDPMFR